MMPSFGLGWSEIWGTTVKGKAVGPWFEPRANSLLRANFCALYLKVLGYTSLLQTNCSAHSWRPTRREISRRTLTTLVWWNGLWCRQNTSRNRTVQNIGIACSLHPTEYIYRGPNRVDQQQAWLHSPHPMERFTMMEYPHTYSDSPVTPNANSLSSLT